ncbi:hypothetical protein PIROE2DRAFT_10915 [Piromyces sp. E2]|nr:hypothetical protein PIROE2DRAFT_10915 [Piromyces sp. E2]|eukprot:OUM62708.1 hypothetical protein PIROE2DRAFT_10915 [Piromyces sp. E2]
MESLLLHTNLVTLNLSKIPLNQNSINFLLNALNHSHSQSMAITERNKYTMMPTTSITNTTLLSLKHLILCQCQLSLPAIEMILNAIKNYPTLQVLRLANNVKDYQINNPSEEEDNDDTNNERDSEEEEDDDDDDDDNGDNDTISNEKGRKRPSLNAALSMTVLNSLLTSSNSQLQLIDLSYNKFPAAMLFQLIRAFNNLQPRLHTMDLSGMDLGISCTELLAKNLKSYFANVPISLNNRMNQPHINSNGDNKSLKTLLLSNNKIRPKGLILLMKTILTGTKIKEIDLSHNLFTDSISDELGELFKTCQENELQVLGLAGYKNQEENDDTKEYEYLHNHKNCMCSISDSEKEIESDDDDDNDDDDDDNNDSELRYGSTNEQCLSTLKQKKSSKNTKKNDNSGSSSSGNGSSSNKLQTNTQPQNNERNYSEFSFGNIGCQKIIKNLQYHGHQLTSINLSYQQIENNTLEILAEQLFYLPYLLLIDLQHNYITDNGLISFMDNISKNGNNITEKKLSSISSTVTHKEKIQKLNDSETVINLEYNFINFISCRERIKIFNNNSKNNYIIYAKNQNIY